MQRVTIGGSEAAAALGLSPWCSPLQLYARKIGAVKNDVDNEHTRFGKRFEKLVLEESSEQFKRERTPFPEGRVAGQDALGMLYVHPDRPWQTCHPDGFWLDSTFEGPGLVEVKTTTRKFDDDEPPVEWQIQLQHNLEVLGLKWGSLAIMRGKTVLPPVDYKVDEAFVKQMLAGEQAFVETVELRIPPRASYVDSKVLSALYKDHSVNSVDLDSEAVEIDAELQEAKAAFKLAETHVEDLKNRLKEMIGGALIGVLPNGVSYRWSTVNKKSYEVKAQCYRQLNRMAARR